MEKSRRTTTWTMMGAALMVLTLGPWPVSGASLDSEFGQKPGLWERFMGTKAERPKEPSTLTKVARKLAALKSRRQEMARRGGDRADLAKMDARIDGFERLHDLLSRRDLMVRAGGGPRDIAKIDERIFKVRDQLRILAIRESNSLGKSSFTNAGIHWQQNGNEQKTAPWRNPYGSLASESPTGSLRQSMGL